MRLCYFRRGTNHFSVALLHCKLRLSSGGSFPYHRADWFRAMEWIGLCATVFGRSFWSCGLSDCGSEWSQGCRSAHLRTVGFVPQQLSLFHWHTVAVWRSSVGVADRVCSFTVDTGSVSSLMLAGSYPVSRSRPKRPSSIKVTPEETPSVLINRFL